MLNNSVAVPTITRCVLTLERVHSEHEKAAGFSPPTTPLVSPGEAQALLGEHRSDKVA